MKTCKKSCENVIKEEKKMKKLLAVLLAAAMVLSMAACGSNKTDTPATNAPTTPAQTEAVAADSELAALIEKWAEVDAMNHDDQSDTIYYNAMGDFMEAYEVAKEELDDVDLRAALMAIAEAKMMEAAIFEPVYGNGGNYAMTRFVPRSSATVSWGLDEYRWYTMLITNELLKTEDRDALIGLWGAAETFNDYIAAAKDYLAENGYTLGDTYNAYNNYQLETWDCIASSYTSDAYFIAPTYSPLMEYDGKDVLQPGLAESYEVSDDGLTYTFHIRKGVKWVDRQEKVVADVTANDWVTSMMHVADNNDALGYLMSANGGCGIKNYDAYINGEVAFSEVGVKAVDDYTLEYTLEAKFPAFLTMLGYGCFAPMNYEFYKAQGGTFGAEGDDYTAGDYGTTPDNIAYCGAYIVDEYVQDNVTAYKLNPTYWNMDAVNTPNFKVYYNDGSDTLRIYNEAKAGTFSGGGFNASALVKAKEEIPEGETESYFDLYSYTTVNSASTYCAWLNVFRASWNNFNDETVGVSSQDDLSKLRTRTAMNNQNFRLALCFAFDRGAYNGVSVGEDLKYASLRNSYTPGTFLQLTADTTVDINGTATTFPAGTYYGEIEQAQLDADGIPIQVWDPTADSGVGSGDGFDGWYSPENAVAFLQKAIAELAEEGVEVSAENPIHLDVPYGAYNEVRTNQANAYKQFMEANLNGCVVIDLVAYEDSTALTNSYYRISTGDEANYDVNPGGSGWGPDYRDAQSYLDTMLPYGYMMKSMGLY